MKKIIFTIFLLTILSMSFIFAEDTYDNTEYVVDSQNKLSQSEIDDLNNMILEFKEKYRSDIYIIIRDRLYPGKSSRLTAEAIYDDNDFGHGEDKSGVLLMLSMEDRDYAIVTTGKAITALTDYGLGKIEDEFLPYLKKDKYYEGFAEFIDLNTEFFKEYRRGKPFDVNHKYRSSKSRMKAEIAIVVISLVIGIFIPFTFTFAMKTAKREKFAMEYVKEGSFNLNTKKDRYLYSNVTRTKIQKSNSSGSSGGGSTISSSGHGGSSGKF